MRGLDPKIIEDEFREINPSESLREKFIRNFGKMNRKQRRDFVRKKVGFTNFWERVNK